MSHTPKRIFDSEESYRKTKNLLPVFDRYHFLNNFFPVRPYQDKIKRNKMKGWEIPSYYYLDRKTHKALDQNQFSWFLFFIPCPSTFLFLSFSVKFQKENITMLTLRLVSHTKYPVCRIFLVKYGYVDTNTANCDITY